MPVEEAAEHLELPAQADGKARKKSGDECFYFYQGKIDNRSRNSFCNVIQEIQFVMSLKIWRSKAYSVCHARDFINMLP